MKNQDLTFFNQLPAVDLLARCIWGEARGESREGKIAVAWVIKNRVADGRFGKGVHGVILRPYQFSCFLTGDPNFRKLREACLNETSYEECDEISGQVLSGEIPDPTGGATHYHTVAIKPPWSGKMTFLRKIGNHRFYLEPRRSK